MKSRFGLGSVAVIAAMISALLIPAVGAQTAWSCDGQAATILGTPGNDTLRGTPGVDVIVGRQGDDFITALGGDDIVCAGQGNDVIYGGDGFDIVFSAQGDDVIYAANGETTADRADTRGARMFGGAGDDVIYGSDRWDRMQGGPGADELHGYEGRDWMRAGADNDTVDGGPGTDDLHGGNGADVIEVTLGDIVRGGAGFDTCNFPLGNADFLLSCGFNQREGSNAPVAIQPIAPGFTTTAAPTTTTTTTNTTAEAPVTIPAPTAANVEISSCDARDETVGITNTGGQTINLAGWTLHDEDKNFSTDLAAVTLAPGATVVMVSGSSPVGGQGRVVWSDRPVWNNDGDTATLLRPGGSVAATLGC